MPALIVIGGGIAGLSTAMLLLATATTSPFSNATRRRRPHPERGLVGVGATRRQSVPAAAPVHGPLPRAPRHRAVRRRARLSRPPARCGSTASSSCPSSSPAGSGGTIERFEQLTGRRPMVEAAIARVLTPSPASRSAAALACEGSSSNERPSGRKARRRRRRPTAAHCMPISSSTPAAGDRCSASG